MKLHKKIANFFSYNLTRRHKTETTTIEAAVNIIAHYRVDLFLDVGANIGQYDNAMRAHGYTGEIHSFEPVNEAFAQRQNACRGDPKWHAHQLAMSTRRGKKVMHIAKTTDLSSFHRPNTYGQRRFKNFDVVRKQEVEMDCLLIKK